MTKDTRDFLNLNLKLDRDGKDSRDGVLIDFLENKSKTHTIKDALVMYMNAYNAMMNGTQPVQQNAANEVPEKPSKGAKFLGKG